MLVLKPYGRGAICGRGGYMRSDILICLFIVGALFFNWPLMSIFKDNLVISLFLIWLIFIILIFMTSIFSEREDS